MKTVLISNTGQHNLESNKLNTGTQDLNCRSGEDEIPKI